MSKRIPQLDGIRGIAILSVFLFHAPLLPAHLRGVMWIGVDLFFILSSFLITGVLLKSRELEFGPYVGRFYARRVRRILIPYLLTLAIATLFIGTAWMRHAYLYLGLTNLLQPLRIAQPYQLSPLWSLAVEEQFYFVWPIAVFFLSRRNLTRLATAMLLLAPLLRGLCHFHDYSPIYMLPWFRMDLLAVGALLALHWEEVAESVGTWSWLMVAGGSGLAVETLMGWTVFSNTRTANVLIYESSLLLCTGCMIWAISGRRVGILTWKPLMYLGTISYTMYLTHMFFLSMKHSPFLELGLTAGYASLSWFLIEKPLLGDRSLQAFLAKALQIARGSQVEGHRSGNISANTAAPPLELISPAD